MTQPGFNPLVDRLAGTKPCIGSWLVSGSPVVAEAVASLGYSWMCVDMEHSGTGISQVEALFMAMERHGAAPVARMASADPHLARRLLDLGAQGLIVSTVEDPAAFSEFADFTAFPPAGRRGVGLSRANGFGDHFDAYLRDFQPVIIPMIETTKGVEAADAIAALPSVSALFLGPYDLSASLGCPGDFDAPAFAEAVDQVRKACEDNGKALGIHQVEPDPLALKNRIEQGFRLIAFGTDLMAVRTSLGRIRDLLD